MRRTHATLAALAALTLTTGCTADAFTTLNHNLSESRKNTAAARAQYLATSAMYTQLALSHVATALASLASADFNGGRATGIGTLDSDIETRYDVDLAAGTGSVKGVQNGKTVIDLIFSFERDIQPNASTYKATNVAGGIDGFALVLPEMRIFYAPQKTASGELIRDRDGNQAFVATAEASGALFLGPFPVISLPKTALGIAYPIPAETDVGRIVAVQDGMRFEGDVQIKDRALHGNGLVKDDQGATLFTLTAAGSSVQIGPVALWGQGPPARHRADQSPSAPVGGDG